MKGGNNIKRKNVVVISYKRKNDREFYVHTGGPYKPEYWSIFSNGSNYVTVETLKKYFNSRKSKAETLRFIPIKDNKRYNIN